MGQEYFPHDYYARLDPKIEQVRMKHGIAGYGVYWVIVERLHQWGGELNVNMIPAIAAECGVKESVVHDIIYSYSLFRIDKDKVISDRVKANLQKRKEIGEQRRNAANARWQMQNLFK